MRGKNKVSATIYTAVHDSTSGHAGVYGCTGRCALVVDTPCGGASPAMLEDTAAGSIATPPVLILIAGSHGSLGGSPSWLLVVPSPDGHSFRKSVRVASHRIAARHAKPRHSIYLPTLMRVMWTDPNPSAVAAADGTPVRPASAFSQRKEGRTQGPSIILSFQPSVLLELSSST